MCFQVLWEAYKSQAPSPEYYMPRLLGFTLGDSRIVHSRSSCIRENVKSRRTSVNRSSSPGKKMNPSWWERRGTQLLPLMKCQLLTNVDWERQKENNGVLHARSIQEARCTSQHPIEFLPSAVIIPQSCTLSSPVTTGCGSWLAAQTGQRYFHNIRIYVRRILNTANEYHPEAAEKQYQQSR
ncbi:hypothetical protein FIBSPDRAFT_120993 [Athelia psychrophila]|uniref:Uncharacterized protein n=1 Tax=Athelia psychrophila TaxID=1759441 RepID=A0A166CSJ7_9AGAM|nr:hypothetical protein FIBSPDRAFT_120993 [Fibularhizoctonia sp. CBS 109695]